MRFYAVRVTQSYDNHHHNVNVDGWVHNKHTLRNIPKPNEKMRFWQGGALSLNQALPALKQLNLRKLSDAGGFKIRGCPTWPKAYFLLGFGINTCLLFLPSHTRTDRTAGFSNAIEMKWSLVCSASKIAVY